MIKAKLQEKDEQIKELREEMRFLRQLVNGIVSSPV